MSLAQPKENDREPLGLYVKDEILPIFSTEINAEINDKFAKVKLSHTYYNPYDEYLDTKFKYLNFRKAYIKYLMDLRLKSMEKK